MTFALARNMSAPSRHHATVRPVEIRPTAGPENPGLVVADIGPRARRYRQARELAAWLLECLGEPYAENPVEALRARIEREVDRRELAGCAVVSRVKPGADDDGVSLTRLTDLSLALVLLSKSSDVVWVARKTPILDVETLGRHLVTRDPRFASGGAR